MVVCLDMSVDQDVDLVFSEYVLNDGRVLTINTTKTKDVERLTRRVYALPNKPAMANMQVMSYGQAFPYMGRLKSDVWKDTDVWTPFHFTPEDIYGAVVQYYGTQWLSFRTATYRTVQVQPLITHAPSCINFYTINAPADFARMVHAEHRLDYKDIFQDDGMHPNDKGHKVMADLAVWMIIQSVIDVFLHPFDADDARHITEDLPPPMVPEGGLLGLRQYTQPAEGGALGTEAVTPPFKMGGGSWWSEEYTQPQKGGSWTEAGIINASSP
eukprot:gene15650-21757_t